VDLLVDLSGSTAHGMLLGGLYADLEEALEVGIDLVTVASLRTPTTRSSQLHFRETVAKERMMIYAAA
jgi:predicted nucleotidyltransferase